MALVEVKQYVKDIEDKKTMHDYLKTFIKLSKSDAEKLSEEIKGLNNLKIKEDQIVKIIDFLPKDSEEINKIFIETSLSEEEINAISNVVKKY